MKIAIVTPGFSANDDDWCIPFLLTLVRQVAQHHDVHVFTLRYPYERRDYQVGGAKVTALGGATASGLQKAPLLYRAIRAVAAAAPFDVVHGCWADEAGFVAVRAARAIGARSIVSLMGGELVDLPEIGYGGWRSRIGRNLTRYSLRHADTVTVCSRFLGELAHGMVAPEKVREIPLPFDSSVFANVQRTQAENPLLLHVASLVGVKDQTTLLQAFARVVAVVPQARLKIAGDGVLRPQLERLVTELRLEEHVEFLGKVPHEELVEWYGSADLLVMSSLHESQCMVLLEAAACGCPAVSTRVGLFPQLLPPENIVSPQDAAALAQAILTNLSDDSHRLHLAQSLRKKVHNEFNTTVIVNKFLALYNELPAPQKTGVGSCHQLP